MKRALWALLLTAMVGSSTGCCLVDRVFHCHHCGPAGCGAACGGGCGEKCRSGGIYGDQYCHGRGIGCALLARGRCRDGACADAGVPSGPPTAQVTYPYYTLRGPRDFLSCDPQGLDSY